MNLKLYHYSEKLFTRFDTSKSSRSAVWGPGIYCTDVPGISESKGWGKTRSPEGYLYTVVVHTTKDRVLDGTQPLPDWMVSKLETAVERSLPDRTIPFFAMERRFGSVAEALEPWGFDVFVHPPPGSHKGNHYVVTNPSLITIQSVAKIEKTKEANKQRWRKAVREFTKGVTTMNLNAMIRKAYANPELRSQLLPQITAGVDKLAAYRLRLKPSKRIWVGKVYEALEFDEQQVARFCVALLAYANLPEAAAKADRILYRMLADQEQEDEQNSVAPF